MDYNIKTIEAFEKQASRLIKKYPLSLIQSLKQFPAQGTSLGNHCYKIRIAIASKRKGKSGGARIETHIVIADTTVYLLTIYDKSEKTDLSNKELAILLRAIPV